MVDCHICDDCYEEIRKDCINEYKEELKENINYLKNRNLKECNRIDELIKIPMDYNEFGKLCDKRKEFEIKDDAYKEILKLLEE